jgi:hypothetical protein
MNNEEALLAFLREVERVQVGNVPRTMFYEGLELMTAAQMAEFMTWLATQPSELGDEELQRRIRERWPPDATQG